MAAVGDAIHIAATELRPWIKTRVGEWPPDRNGRTEPNDPSYLVSVLLDHWSERFAGELGSEGKSLVHEFRHTRNRWAHHRSFDRLDTFRAVDTCRLLLRAIGSDRETVLIDSALRVLNDADPGRLSTVDAGNNRMNARARRRSLTTHRKAQSEDFRKEQWDHRFDSHVAPINRLVDDLIADHSDRWMPYVAPYHGGTRAKVLLLFQDPGRMTAPNHGGSGFIGCENDDPSAEELAECLDRAGVPPSEVTPWNSYPWFVPDQRGVTVGKRLEGLQPLCRLLALLSELHTVVTQGSVAHDTWQRFARAYPAEAGRLRHLKTFHTSGRGVTDGGQQTKAIGEAHIVRTLKEASRQTRND